MHKILKWYKKLNSTSKASIFGAIVGAIITGAFTIIVNIVTPAPQIIVYPATEKSIPTQNPTLTPLSNVGLIDSHEIEMVLVPEGTFRMGDDSELAKDDEGPVHEVFLNDYYIDKFEVTNELFAIFLNDQGNQLEGAEYWLQYNDPENDNRIRQIDGIWISDEGFENHPVTEVTWFGANAYCNWRDARLPTEAEWEKAARGLESSTYPWGNIFYGQKLNFCDKNCMYCDSTGCRTASWAEETIDDGYEMTSPVGSYLGGISPYGTFDMAGNVIEWVADWYDAEYYHNSPKENPLGPSEGIAKVLRGGAWMNNRFDSRTTTRYRLDPSSTDSDYGFRCAKNT